MIPELSPTLREFCDTEDLLRLAYLDSKGCPRVVPLWFVRIDGEYYVGTGTSSAKWKAMQRNPRVGWVIDGGPRNRYKGASMRGRVEEVRGAIGRASVYKSLGEKYFGALDDAKYVEIFGRVDDPETVYLRLIPEDGMTWEH